MEKMRSNEHKLLLRRFSLDTGGIFFHKDHQPLE